MVQGVRSRPKAFWQYVYSRTKVRPGNTELVSTDRSAIQSDVDMATHFNEYFSSVFQAKSNYESKLIHDFASNNQYRI